MSMGGENTVATTTSSFKSVEHVIESDSKETAVSGHASHTDTHTQSDSWYSLDGGPSQG